MEELSGPQTLGHGVMEGEPRHGLVGELGVDPHHVGPFQPFDEGQHVSDRWQEQVAPRLIGLGLEGEAQLVAATTHVGAQGVDGFGVAVEGGSHVLGGVTLDALTSAPADVHRGAQLDAEVDGIHGPGQGVAAHRPVVGRESTFLEHRQGEEVGRRHRHKVAVMEVHAVGAEVGQPVHRFDWVEGRTHFVPERVSAPIAHRPEAEGEAMLGPGMVRVGHTQIVAPTG